MQSLEVAWSDLFAARSKIRERYRSIYEIPLLKNRRGLFRLFLRNGMKVLDCGAGFRGAKIEIERLGIRLLYKSMDIDKRLPHDFYTLADIQEKFDAVLLFEVLEHLSLTEAKGLLLALRELLADEGLLLASVPNTYNPSRYMADATHRTFFAYDELCGLISLCGFEILYVARSFNDAAHRYIVKVYILGFLFRLLSLDYAKSIFVVGKKT
jgi:hypothetical protein